MTGVLIKGGNYDTDTNRHRGKTHKEEMAGHGSDMGTGRSAQDCRQTAEAGRGQERSPLRAVRRSWR